MKQIYIVICFLCLSLAAQTQQPVKLNVLVEELADLTPKNRIIRASKHLDTLIVVGIPLQQVSQRIDSIQKLAHRWQDGELAGYLHFYDKMKRGFLPIPNNEILTVFDSTLYHFEKKGDLRYTGVCHYFIGQHHYERQQYGEAFYHHAKAQELFNEVGIANIIDIGKYLHVMALNHYYFRDYERVIQLMRASITLPPFSDNLDIQRYNTLGMAYKQLNQLDSAAFYFKRTQEVASSWRDTTWIHLAAGNLGSVYIKQGRYGEALPFLVQDYQYNQHRDRHPVLARNAAVDIAATWQKLHQQDSVSHYLRESERLNAVVRKGELMWKQQRDEQFYISYYEVLHDHFKAQGNTTMAYRYLDSLTHLTNETNLRYNKMTARVAEDRLKIQQHLADIAVQQAEKKRISARLQLVIGIVGSLAVILALLYYLLRLRHAKDRLQAEKEKIVQQATQEKVEAQLAKATLELQEYMQRLQEKNRLVKAFQMQIDQLRTHSAQQAPQLDELTNRLAETKLLTTDDWNDFRRRFNRAFGGELDQLKMKYRDLTSAEERIYALEKMNVSTSQMAWMLGISPESVRKARYRLRKKIDPKAA
ncbi:hypothetical protein [Parapedobacter tibetensis]|uniref:hypothetical protein n=1 Tax=Parapedobacter tibetensis TaxID=2972951 RepID=UPI00214DEF74|nr:hypothetical protein [Parapedobacter tibetensis]